MVSFLDEICKELDGASLLSTESQVYGYVDSGSKVLNKIISGDFDKGYPIGSITEIYGESSTAKTVFLTHAFIGAQKKGYYCFEAIETIILAIRKKDKETPIMIGYDSIGTSPTRKELDDDFGKNSEMGGALRAKVAGQCLRRINPMLRKYKAGLIIINQVRSKVGVMFGDPRTRAGGGKALLYYCGTSLEAHSGKNDALYDERKNPLGITGTMKAVKNKITKPFQSCEFKLLYDQGLQPEFGLTLEYYKQGLASIPSKGWYSIDEGKTKSRAADLDKKIMEKLNEKN